MNLQPLGVRALQTSADSTRLSSQPGGMSEPFTVTLDQDSFRSYRTDIPPLDVNVTKENLLEWYRQMATMRRMEQAADALYRAKLIRGFCHLAIGQVSLILAQNFSSQHALTRALFAIIVHYIGSCVRRVQLCHET